MNDNPAFWVRVLHRVCERAGVPDAEAVAMVEAELRSSFCITRATALQNVAERIYIDKIMLGSVELPAFKDWAGNAN